MTLEKSETFSTVDVPQASRLERWNDFGSETLSRMVMDPADRGGFRARIVRLMVGDLGFTSVDTSAGTAHGYGGVGAWAAPGKDAFLLSVQDQGSTRIKQAGHEMVLASGDMMLLDATRPHVSETPGPMSMLVIKLPIERLLTRVADPDGMAGAWLRASQGRAAFASSVLLSIMRNLTNESDDDWGAVVSDIVLDVVGMTYGRIDPATACGQSRMRRRREACGYIEQHLEDPALSVGGIAGVLGVSTRYLQRLFLETGATPRQYLLDRRLDRAAQQLRRSADIGINSIADIAFGVGFNDVSYFIRTFGKKFGVSPREYRNALRRRPASIYPALDAS